MRLFLILCLFALALVAPTVAAAQSADAGTDDEPVYETIIRAERAPSALMRTSAAVTVVDADEALAGRPRVGLEEALSLVPGVVARGGTNAAQDLRLSIRGFGARSAFGVRGITLLVDGFPETLPDGQAQVDALELGTVSRIEVLRGLAASLYGNASGGVIRIETARAGETPGFTLRTSGGSYGQLKVLAFAEARRGEVGTTFALSRLTSDGFRRHARTEQTTLNSNVDARVGTGKLFVSFSFVDSPLAEDPGGLTAEAFRETPRAASPIHLRFDAGESVRQGRLGVSWTHAVSAAHEVELLAFGTLRSFQNAIPFTIVAFERSVGGGALRSTWEQDLGRWSGRLTAAAEAQLQVDDRTNSDNEAGAPIGDFTLAQSERVLGSAVWAQQELTAPFDLTVVLGARLDWSEYQARDRLLADGDASGARSFLQPTGRLGAVFHPSSRFALYGSLSQAFETPTTTELVDLVNGGFSRDLRAQRADGAELGMRGGLERVTWDVAAFGVLVNDGLIRQEDALGRARYVNAARSRHAGVELAGGVALGSGLRLDGAYTLIDARFLEYEVAGVEHAGNAVPGIPRHNGAAALSWKGEGASRVVLEASTVGARYADDANLTREPLRMIVDARIDWPLTFGSWRVSPFAGIRNLLGTRYADGLRLNAAGGRYFEPAPPLTVQGGFSVQVRPTPRRAEVERRDAVRGR